MRHDLLYALRALRKSPGFTAIAIVTLALGIGANTSIFSLVNALFLRPLPAVEDSERLVSVSAARGERIGYYGISHPDFVDFLEGQTPETSFSSLAAHGRFWVFLNDGDDGGEAREIEGNAVSAGFFETLGLEPALGRFFDAEEYTTLDAHPVVVLSHHLWQRRYRGDPEILGRTVEINGVDMTVIGIAPERFDGVYASARTDAWLPLAFARVRPPHQRDAMQRDARFLELVGRLAPGRTLKEARSEMDHLAARIAAAHPEENQAHPDAPQRGVHVASLRGVHPGSRDGAAELPARLTAAATLMLLIVCANLAGLLTARNAERDREIAVRLALGAKRRRLVRLFLAEGFVLAAVGGTLGILLAFQLKDLIKTFYMYGYEALEPGIEPRVLAFAVGLSLLTGLVFTLVPAVKATRGDLLSSLRESSSSAWRSRLRAVLVTSQIALALVLMVGAGLSLKSIDRLLLAPDYDPHGVAHFRLRANRLGYDLERATVYHREVIRRLEELPGVESATLARVSPERGWCCPLPVARPGKEPIEVENNETTPGYFRTLGIALLAGRDFAASDTPESSRVAIVNRALASRLWGEEAALGQVLEIDGEAHEIVGVTADIHPARPGEGEVFMVYRSFWQAGLTWSRLFVRVEGDPSAALPDLRRELVRVDSAVHVGQVMPLIDRARMTFQSERLIARMLSLAGILGLVLSALGLYGTVAFAVTRRTREFGIRSALGARSDDLLLLVVREASLLVFTGLLIGALAAWGGSRFLDQFLYGVGRLDAGVYVGVALLLGGVTLFASALPARRASRVAPSTALRYE